MGTARAEIGVAQILQSDPTARIEIGVINIIYSEKAVWEVFFENTSQIVATLTVDQNWPPLVGRWLYPVSEKLVFNTEILASHNRTYQRRARKQGLPQRIITKKLALESADDFAAYEASIHSWLKQRWHVDLWELAEIHTGSISSGASTISVDTRYAGFAAGQHALIWQSNSYYDYVKIASVTDSQLMLDTTPDNSYTGSKFIMPVKTGWCIAAAKPKWYHDCAIADMSFLIEDIDDVTGFTADLTYDSYTVLTNPSKSTARSADFVHEPDFFVQDAGTGPFNIIDNSDYNITTQSHGWVCESKQAAWELRQFLYNIKGRQSAFLVPTFKYDLELSRAVGSSDTVIYVVNNGIAAEMGINDLRTYLAFRPSGGNIIVRKVIDLAVVDAAEEKITINTAPGQTFSAGEKLCWVDRCNLASDSIEFNWYLRGKCFLKMPLERVEN